MLRINWSTSIPSEFSAPESVSPGSAPDPSASDPSAPDPSASASVSFPAGAEELLEASVTVGA